MRAVSVPPSRPHASKGGKIPGRGRRTRHPLSCSSRNGPSRAEWPRVLSRGLSGQPPASRCAPATVTRTSYAEISAGRYERVVVVRDSAESADCRLSYWQAKHSLNGLIRLVRLTRSIRHHYEVE